MGKITSKNGLVVRDERDKNSHKLFEIDISPNDGKHMKNIDRVREVVRLCLWVREREIENEMDRDKMRWKRQS